MKRYLLRQTVFRKLEYHKRGVPTGIFMGGRVISWEKTALPQNININNNFSYKNLKITCSNIPKDEKLILQKLIQQMAGVYCPGTFKISNDMHA